jgi:hypothetical protein
MFWQMCIVTGVMVAATLLVFVYINQRSLTIPIVGSIVLFGIGCFFRFFGWSVKVLVLAWLLFTAVGGLIAAFASGGEIIVFFMAGIFIGAITGIPWGCAILAGGALRSLAAQRIQPTQPH